MVLIQELRLLNFQKHRQLKLLFAPGLNVLVGPTDAGKSAAFRAIKWVAQHEAATGFITHGEKVMKVGIRTDEGALIRFKDSKKYGYKLGEEEFLACAKDQPADVSKFLRIHPYNFQSQHEPHFLLNLTPGQVAKEINRIVALEDIDKANTFLKTKSVRLGTLIQGSQDKIALYETRLAEFSDLDAKLALLGKMGELVKSLDDTRRREGLVRSAVDNINYVLLGIRQTSNKLSKLELLADAASRVEALRTRKQALGSILIDLKACEALPKLNALQGILEAILAKAERLAALKRMAQQDYATYEEVILAFSKQISTKAESGATIVAGRQKRRESLQNVLETLKRIRSEFKDAQAVVEQIEQSILKAETPVKCKMCNRCVTVCPE